MSGNLWSVIRECVDDETLTRAGRSVGDIASGHVTDAILAIPEMAALLADAERVRRVRAEVDTWGDASRDWYAAHRYDETGPAYGGGFEDGWGHAEELIRHVLDSGPS